MRVLSLFDGISCGQLAFQRAGIPVEKYYASEIDKNAIKITQKNFPDTIQLGDVTQIDFKQFAGEVDLIMGGSPCQDLSIAGNRAGLLGDRSGLFYKFVEAIEVIKPKYYLLENNYGMPPEAYEEISQFMGCYPIMIDSALVSAQRRKRFYWFNWGDKKYDLFGFPTCNIPQPKNKGILLKDIYIPDDTLIKVDERILKHAVKRNNYIQYDISGKGHSSTQDRLYFLNGKSPCVSKCRTETKHNMLIDENDWSKYKIISPVEAERLQTLPDNYTDCVPKTARFEAIGNGWTVDVISYIFQGLKKEL
jgi:DNA (cytosine-5)-methyltransferase 3A